MFYLFIYFSPSSLNAFSVIVGVSQPLHSWPHCACSLHPLHPHVEGLETSNKDAQRLGSLEPCHRVKFDLSERSHRLRERRRRTTSFLGFGARALHRHGTEEIYIGHRARAQELRSCVGNGVDNGQRWASSTKNNKIKGNKDKNGRCVAGNVQLWSQLFFSVCFAVRMPSQHLEFKWLKRDSQKVWDGINSAALVLKSVLRPLCANRG